MGTNQNENETDQELDKRLKCACGWDEEKLLKELEDAEKEISEEDLPLSGKYSFERLLKDIEERKIEPERGDREEAESGQNLETSVSAGEGEVCSLQQLVILIRASVAAVTAASAMLFLCMF